MATVTGLTATRMLAIEAASVVSGEVDENGHLILTTHDDTEIDAGYIIASVPDASSTVKGLVELATNAETITGTDATRAVTPESLLASGATHVPDASTTIKGKVELATNLEATTGADTTRAVTPSNLATVAGTFVPSASLTVQGKVELATDVEATTGTDTSRAITPANLAAAVATHIPVASTTVQGKIELATSAETITGTDTDRAITPSGLAAAGPKGAVPGGYAEITANVSSSNSAALTVITGLVVTVTLANTRRYKVTTFTRLQNTVAGRLFGGITDSVLGGIQNVSMNAALANVSYHLHLERILVGPSSGTHIFSAQFQSFAGGSITCAAAAANPSFILVEDIGPV